MKIRYYHLFLITIISIAFTVFSCSDNVNEEDPADDKDSNADVSNTPNNGDSTANVSNTLNSEYTVRKYFTISKTIYLIENRHPIEHLKLPDIKEFCIDGVRNEHYSEHPISVVFHKGYFYVLEKRPDKGEIIIDNNEKLNEIKKETLHGTSNFIDSITAPYADDSRYKLAITLHAKCDCTINEYVLDTNSVG